MKENTEWTAQKKQNLILEMHCRIPTDNLPYVDKYLSY